MAKRAPSHTMLELNDVSTGTAKRYRANILVDAALDRDGVEAIIAQVTSELRKSRFYGSPGQKRWKNKQAHVVWLFVYRDAADVAMANWICRSQWIDPKLAPDFRPTALDGAALAGDIVIEWQAPNV